MTETDKFERMWLNPDVTPKMIAEHFGVSTQSVHKKRVARGLPLKGLRGFMFGQYGRQIGERNAERLLKSLKEKGGFTSFRDLHSQFSLNLIERLKHQGILFGVRFTLGRATGANAMRKKQHLIFRKPYLGECFVCNSRTSVVRLTCQALKKPRTMQIQKSTTNFLKQYLTSAERIAVMWNLGKRNWSRTRVKSSIQIDGIVKPTKRFLEKELSV